VRFSRRALLLALPGAVAAQGDDDDRVREGRVLRFPRDHGAHTGARIEWWYATGWLDAPTTPIGFQITFFRHRTGLGEGLTGRFAPRQLLFAHAAVSDIGAQRHLQAQRVARWSGDAAARDAMASRDDTGVRQGGWSLRREPGANAGRYLASVGGVNLQALETDFGTASFMVDRYMPAGVLLALSLEELAPRFLNVPGKGHFFWEPLAKVGASENSQLYGEIGLEYGNERKHAKIVNATTAFDAVSS